MKLKHSTETYIEVEYGDLNDLITKHFSFTRERTNMDKYYPEPENGIYLKEFEFVAVEESSNDTSHTFQVDGKLSKWDEEEMEEMLEKQNYDCFSTRRILNYLASKGVIETGNYLINVCW